MRRRPGVITNLVDHLRVPEDGWAKTVEPGRIIDALISVGRSIYDRTLFKRILYKCSRVCGDILMHLGSVGYEYGRRIRPR